MRRGARKGGKGGYPKTIWVIENWSTRTHPSATAFDAPETMICITGRCSNRGNGFEKAIITSPIARVDGRIVYTTNGSKYVLGKPDPAFVAFCRERGCHVPTHKHPLKIHKQFN